MRIFIDNLCNKEEKDYSNISDSMKNKLYERYKKIIGKEYAEKLIEKLKEIKEIQIPKINNENNLEELSNKIIDILISLITDEFNKYINDLIYKQEKYKDFESGNFIEFLLFNDFSQYMTLKECLFLLNEDNYKKTNFIKFRSEFKNLVGKNNDDFLKELNEGHKIFEELFIKYNSIYDKKKNISNDLITRQNFRGNNDNSLNKKFEAIECFNFRRSRFEHLKKSD